MIKIGARAAMLAALAVCAGGAAAKPVDLPTGDAAYAAIPVNAEAEDEDVIRLGDRLSIKVLGEPELTSDEYYVDSNGYIQMPLAGEVIAAGRRPAELRDDLAQRLGARYIRDPQLAVIITERHKSTFVVEGEVREPGIFESTTKTTLLSAIAQARSPTDTARLNEVMIFRIVNGQRMGARFDLRDIRKGRAPDPQVLAGDTVVVGYSGVKGAWKQFLQAAPAFNLFYIFR